MLISAGVYEVRTTRDALFPQAIFSNFNISMSTFPLVPSFLIFLVILLTVSLLHNVAFNAGTFYLALYYQVCSERLLRVIRTLRYTSNLDCQSVDLKSSCWSYAPSILLRFISGIDACCLAPRHYSGTHAQYLWPKMGYLGWIVNRYNRFWRVLLLSIPPTLSPRLYSLQHSCGFLTKTHG